MWYWWARTGDGKISTNSEEWKQICIQGAPLVENQDANNTNNEIQGAPEGIPNIKDKQDDILIEDVEEDKDTDDKEEPVGRRAEK